MLLDVFVKMVDHDQDDIFRDAESVVDVDGWVTIKRGSRTYMLNRDRIEKINYGPAFDAAPKKKVKLFPEDTHKDPYP